MLSDTGSRSRLIPSPPSNDYNNYHQQDSSYPSVGPQGDVYSPQPNSIESYVNRAGLGANGGVVLRQGTMSSSYPGETPNPYRTTVPQTAGYDDDQSATNESDDTASMNVPIGQAARSRGVALADNGPVPGPEGGVRRVARPQSRRPSSQQMSPNRYSRSSMYQLPPGAAPPRPYGDGY